MVTSVRTDGNITVPENMSDNSLWLRIIAAKINQILRGKTNNVGTVTLTASSTTTDVSVAIGVFGANTVMVFEPTTANAATAFGSGSFYVSVRDPRAGTYTITHPSTADTDKTFRVAYIG